MTRTLSTAAFIATLIALVGTTACAGSYTMHTYQDKGCGGKPATRTVHTECRANWDDDRFRASCNVDGNVVLEGWLGNHHCAGAPYSNHTFYIGRCHLAKIGGMIGPSYESFKVLRCTDSNTTKNRVPDGQEDKVGISR
jgi:hypothetical protein